VTRPDTKISELRLDKVSRSFGGVPALEGLDLTIRGGEFVALLGPSGCGKSTALNCLAGLLPLSGGSIWLDERRIDTVPPEQRGFGMVFQNYALFPHMSVRANIAFGLRMASVAKAESKRRVDEALALVQLGDHADKFPGQLSGGQQQRVAIARAIVMEPALVLMDEPLSNLDAKLRLEMRTEIKRIHQTLGLTTVYVTHDQEEALSLSDRVVVMSEGRMEQVGTPFEIYNFPTTAFVASFVGTLNLLPGVVADAGRGELTIAGQPVRIGQSFEGSAGRQVNVALRPEMVSLGATGDGQNQLTGKVTDVSFLGSIVRIRVGLGHGATGAPGAGGPIVVLDEFNEPTLKLPQLQDTVTISFPQDGPLVLDVKVPVESVEALIAEA
jgi:putative spermidine/putrescine transport system ATP-binding protein